MSPDAERIFQLAMQVFHEYLKDCDSDIRGCDGTELAGIEICRGACLELRRRFVTLATGEPCDERGVGARVICDRQSTPHFVDGPPDRGPCVGSTVPK